MFAFPPYCRQIFYPHPYLNSKTTIPLKYPFSAQTSRKTKTTTKNYQNQPYSYLKSLSLCCLRFAPLLITPEFTQSLSPRVAHLTRSRGMLAHLLWSLPPVCAYLLFCRGLGAAIFTLKQLSLRAPHLILRMHAKETKILAESR